MDRVTIRARLNITRTLPSISARPRRRHVARALRRIALRRSVLRFGACAFAIQVVPPCSLVPRLKQLSMMTATKRKLARVCRGLRGHKGIWTAKRSIRGFRSWIGGIRSGSRLEPRAVVSSQAVLAVETNWFRLRYRGLAQRERKS